MSDSKSERDYWLLCRVGAPLCALPLSAVVETMRPLPVEPLAGMPSFVRGLSVIRGAPVPVVDAGALLGTGEASRPTRFVTLRAGERRVALAVEEVIGIRALPPDSLEALPPLLRDASAEVVSLVGTLDAELLVVLGQGKIVPDAAWKATEAQPVEK